MTKKRIKQIMRTVKKWRKEFYKENSIDDGYLSISAWVDKTGKSHVDVTWRIDKDNYNSVYEIGGKLYAEDLEK